MAPGFMVALGERHRCKRVEEGRDAAARCGLLGARRIDVDAEEAELDGGAAARFRARSPTGTR
jgi:hypothetical protein